MKRLLGILLSAALLASLSLLSEEPASAQAQVFVDPAASAQATDIVNGRIVSTTSVELDGEAFRVSEIEVLSALKGSLTGTILVETPGGERSDGTVVYVSHTPKLVPGELVQLALAGRGDLQGQQLAVAMDGSGSVYSVVHGSEGAYGLLPDGVGRAAAVGDYTLNGASFPDFSPAVGFYVNPANSGTSTSGTISAVRRAFTVWENDPGSDIDFVYRGTTSKVGLNLNDNQNTVSWVSTGAGWLAQASWIATGGGEIIGFDVRVNRAYNWANGATPGRYDIGTVVAHEVGHGIGFGHAPASAELMYFQIQSGLVKPLGDGDRSGANFLYPTAAPAQLSSPSAGSSLCSGTRVRWTGGSGSFWVTVGVPGARNQFMSAGAGTSRSIVVTGVPSSSESLVTLWQRKPGESSYSVVDEQMQSACNPLPASFASPSAGASLCSGDVVSWTGGSGSFWVTVGVPGARNQYMSAGAGTSRSIVVTGVPSTTETLVTLWQRQASQSSYSVVAQQMQSACNPLPANISSPSAGASLCSGDVVSWTGGSGNFWVTVGVPGARNQYMSAGAGTSRSIVVTGVPSTTQTLVTLWQRQAGQSSYSVVADQLQSPCN